MNQLSSIALANRLFQDILFLIKNDTNGTYNFSFSNGLLNYDMDEGKAVGFYDETYFDHPCETTKVSISEVFTRLERGILTLHYASANSQEDEPGFYVPDYTSASTTDVERHAFKFLFCLANFCDLNKTTIANGTYGDDLFLICNGERNLDFEPGYNVLDHTSIGAIVNSVLPYRVNQYILSDRETWPEIFHTDYLQYINFVKQHSTLTANNDNLLDPGNEYFYTDAVFNAVFDFAQKMHFSPDFTHKKPIDITQDAQEVLQGILTPWENLITRFNLIQKNAVNLDLAPHANQSSPAL